MAELSITDLTASAGPKCLCHDISLRVGAGELVALVGPNGAGKSSLLRAIIGLIPHTRGTVTVDGERLAKMPVAARARTIAYLPQDHDTAWPISVSDAVALARHAWGGTAHRLAPADRAIVDAAMARCGIGHLAAQSTATLSGGERARVALARMLAVQAPLALLDEPVAALDLHHQHGAMREIRRYADDGGGALVVLHDLGLAARYADRLLWMADGRLRAETGVDDRAMIAQVKALYGITPIIVQDTQGRVIAVSAGG